MSSFINEMKDSGWKKYFQEKLIDEKYYIDLSHLDSYVSTYIYIPTLNKSEAELTWEDGNSPQAHEATLQYLYPLLKEGKLKMRKVIQPDDPEDVVSTAGITDRSGPVPVRTYLTAEEAIADLRYVWNRPNNAKNIIGGIEISTHFALPETPWRT